MATRSDRTSRPRLLHLLAVAATLAACGSSQQEETLPPRHLSATEHHNEALRHDREARARDSARRPRSQGEAAAGQQADYGCYEEGREMPEPTAGSERIPVLRPCWTAVTQPKSDNQTDAAAHRREAARHRRMAESLWRAEKRACAGLSQPDIEQSPFSHRDDIVRVEPLRSGNQARGARVVFRAVRGLSADWMRKAITCHQARAAALGYPPQAMSYDPLMAAPTRATVEQRGAEIVVTVTASRDDEAAAVLGRAEALARH